MTKLEKKKKEKKEKKVKKKETPLIKEEKSRLQQVKESFKLNIFLSIAGVLTVFILYKHKKGSSFIITFGSLYSIGFFGYFIHLLFHHLCFTDLFNKYNIFTENRFFNKCMLRITSVFDFHRNIHHNTSINKQPINMVYEFINNFIFQGILPYLLIEIFKRFDVRVCFVWGLTYASVHNINYYYLKPKTHQHHHIDEHKNYGIDIFDIVFGTKYDTTEIENMNHMGFNLIICAFIIIYLNKYFTKLLNNFK
jgi:hypothetical protein